MHPTQTTDTYPTRYAARETPGTWRIFEPASDGTYTVDGVDRHRDTLSKPVHEGAVLSEQGEGTPEIPRFYIEIRGPLYDARPKGMRVKTWEATRRPYFMIDISTDHGDGSTGAWVRADVATMEEAIKVAEEEMDKRRKITPAERRHSRMIYAAEQAIERTEGEAKTNAEALENARAHVRMYEDRAAYYARRMEAERATLAELHAANPADLNA